MAFLTVRRRKTLRAASRHRSGCKQLDEFTGHRANILNSSLRKIGVGYARGGQYGTYWVQLFTG